MLTNILMMPPQYDEYLKYSKLTRAIYSPCLTGNLKMSSDGREKVVMPGMMYQ